MVIFGLYLSLSVARADLLISGRLCVLRIGCLVHPFCVCWCILRGVVVFVGRSWGRWVPAFCEPMLCWIEPRILFILRRWVGLVASPFGGSFFTRGSIILIVLGVKIHRYVNGRCVGLTSDLVGGVRVV